MSCARVETRAVSLQLSMPGPNAVPKPIWPTVNERKIFSFVLWSTIENDDTWARVNTHQTNRAARLYNLV